MEVVENEDTKSARFYQLNELIIQKGFFGILLADIAWCLQKLGMILENKVSIKFKFLNNHFYDKMPLKPHLHNPNSCPFSSELQTVF